MSTIMCIYHGGCNDGFGAAYAVWKKFKDAVEFHPGIYQESIPDVNGKHIIIVDFSYKLDVMREIIARALSVTIIDHHKTARDDIQPLIDSNEVQGIFNTHKSGAVLAWEYFHPHTAVPLLLQYIQDRDLWQFELPSSREIHAGLCLEEQTFEVWDNLRLLELKLTGETLLRMHRKRVDDCKQHAWIGTIGGHTVPIVNAPYYMASDVAGELSEGHPFAAVFWESENHRTYSLRSRDGGLDVSEIAKAFGGGGHKHAAGFKLPHEDASNDTRG